MHEQQFIRRILDNIEKVIIGKENELRQILKGILAGGHILIEDVPGVGKTMIVKALARSLNLSYSRIQFTPDLLPSDILGVSIYNQKTGNFEFKKGPVFANIILADEINRTSPKTQSALLEVMEENQVSEGTHTYLLEEPFIVLATQNPVEHEGTFVLPEAQLDRFMIKVRIGYVSEENESKILQIYKNREPIKEVEPIADAAQISFLQNKVREVTVTRSITDYIARIARATRNNENIMLGTSTRASLALLKVAQANALMESRDFVIPDDVKQNAVAVLAHRIILSPIARASGLKNEDIINDILDKVDIPRNEKND
ncbi:MAG: MoxR family ATPase [Bacillota bacterium]|nr:MoxR family ATPase [Bacillota bacterium]